MNEASPSETATAEATTKARDQIEAAHIQARAAVRAAIIMGVAAVLAGSFALVQFLNKTPDESSTPLSADDIVSINPLPDVISASEQGVFLRGKLHKPLPSGKQLWAAQRQSETPDNDDVSGPGFAVSEICDVAADGKTFDCGLMQLGDNSLPSKRFVIYVGLADSGAARNLMWMRWEQDRDGNYAHTAPRGFDSAEAEIVTRAQ